MSQLDTMSDPADELDRAEGLTPDEAAAELVAAEAERKDILSKLARDIVAKFQDRASKRSSKEIEWQQCQRLYNSPLQGSNLDLPDRPFDTPVNGRRRPEPNIVRIKCDTAIANSYSMQFAGGTEKNWNMFPPPNARDPIQIEKARGMEREIETQLSQTGYDVKCRRAMEDRVIYGTGVVKGPVNTGKQRVKYVKDEATGTWLPKVSQEHAPELEYVPVWRYYPDLAVTDFDEVQDDMEIHPMTAIELAQYVEHPGFAKEAILSILQGSDSEDPIKPDKYNDTLANLTTEMWGRNPYLYRDRYLVIEYHGPVSYDDLNKLGLEVNYDSPSQQYFGEVWVCAGKVIRMELENIEGHYETPYARSIWKRDPSSPFGFGHPLLLADPQQVITQTYHMILDNAALTSGTQVAMYKKFIQPIDGDYTIRPNKVWLLTDPNADIDKAIKFFSPQNNIGNILPVLQLARQFADEESATSGIASGLPSPELTDTATGAREIRQASTTLLDFLAEDWDDQVTEKIVRRWYAWNMQYGKKDDIKGDYVIDVKSSSEFKNKALYIRDLERLSMEVAQNPHMADVVNTDELYRARLALMNLPSGTIIRTPEEIAQAQQARAQQPDPKMMELEVKKMEAETHRAKVMLEEKELQFQLYQQQQREQWEHMERMAANEARMAEAQAQVLRARSEVQVEMLQAAQKNEQFMARLMADKELAVLAENSRVFIESMKVREKGKENSLYQQELEIKKKTGSGI